MKTVSTLKSSKTDSPKTPGGISRSLLTPCRRVGLSRNFRKSGASPFQSPISSNTDEKQEKVETRKRKESLEETAQKPENVDYDTHPEVVQTPTRNVDFPRRKKSKTLLASLIKTTDENVPEVVSLKLEDKTAREAIHKDINLQNEENTEVVSTPVRLKSKSRSKKKHSPSISFVKEIPAVDLEIENLSHNPISPETKEKREVDNKQEEIEEKSPNNLTTECFVVIQKKIFKKELKGKKKILKSQEKPNDDTSKQKEVSQALFDSDSDDVPLIGLNNKEIVCKPATLISIEEGNDFATSKTRSIKPDNKASKSNTNTKSPTSINNKLNSKLVKVHNPNSQSSVDDDDDFFEKKRTILVRKSYDKVLKPQKAKSTGSVTQKDIDDLKAKIEIKKKLLLAKSMSEDTKELKDLIKKWQKGCQDALMELMDLMRSKFPDKQNMDYSEMLQTLKIPASLVGFDSDNDCFLTPEDESIILANVKY